METLSTIEALRAWRKQRWSRRIGLVPTMGYLHEGHMELVRVARRHCDEVVVSVYVNPTQFGPGEDLDSYPRDLEGDRRKCEEAGATALFVPTDEMMYGPERSAFATRVSVAGGMGEHLCGAHRAGHFDGVTLIVSKLFNLVQPDVAVFGEKDYQQLAIVRRMVRELNVPVEIVGVATVREADGLAKSSRNRYLEGAHREEATSLSRALRAAWRAWQSGERDVSRLEAAARERLAGSSEEAIDYVTCVDPESLEVLSGEVAGGCVMAMAVRVGPARLIDNLRLDRELPEGLERVERSEQFS